MVARKKVIVKTKRHDSGGTQSLTAVLFKNGRALAVGQNSYKAQPSLNLLTVHAEVAAVLNYLRTKFHSAVIEKMFFSGEIKNQVKGLKLQVIRHRGDNRIGLAKPCLECQDRLKGWGINKVFYSEDDGSFQELTLK